MGSLKQSTTAELKAELRRVKKQIRDTYPDTKRHRKLQAARGRIEVELLRRGEEGTTRYKVWHGPWSGKVKHWRGHE